MSFMLGCNYWASNAGANMWHNFKAEVVDNDLSILAKNGVKYLRAFPIWSDFQPVEPFLGGESVFVEYTTNGRSDNPFYLDESMLDKFEVFLDLCDKYGLKVIVGIITGWMSGKMFLPAALYNKNLITDPAACYLQQLFIKGFVPKFRNHPALHAWDLGNECNVMAPVNSRSEAALWVANIANAIRAEDKNHPVYSGMHSLTVDGPWSIIDQGIFTDMLTTHPYAIFCEHTYVDRLLSYRTIMHPTVQGKFYADLSGKPCVAEEFGTTGTYVCGDDASADYLRVNLFSLWATGSEGLLWWCANDQNMLTDFPYSRCPLELELGMLTKDKAPKPVLNEMNRFGKLLNSFDFELPPAKTDAVCLLTREQDHWGVGYMTDLLLRRVGINCSFAFCDNKIPDAKLYIMPSVNGACVIPMERYTELKEKVKAGADLYISADKPFIADFSEVVGLRVIDSYQSYNENEATLDEKVIKIEREKTIITESCGATVLATDKDGNPFISVNQYGKGKVYFVNAPIEANLIEKHNAFADEPEYIYSRLFADRTEISVTGKDTVFTYHPTDNGYYVVIINTGSEIQPFEIKTDGGYTVEKVYYGNENTVNPFDACVIKISC